MPDLPIALQSKIIHYARPDQQRLTLQWIAESTFLKNFLTESFLYEEVYIRSRMQLRKLLKSLEAECRGWRGVFVRSFFFDVADIHQRNRCFRELAAVLSRLPFLRVLRVTFDSLDKDALEFWWELAPWISPSLRILRFGDTVMVSCSPLSSSYVKVTFLSITSVKECPLRTTGRSFLRLGRGPPGF